MYNVAVSGRSTLNDLFGFLVQALGRQGVAYAKPAKYGEFRAGDVRHSRPTSARLAACSVISPRTPCCRGWTRQCPGIRNSCVDLKALIRKLGNIHPDHQRIFKGAFRVAVFLLLAGRGRRQEMAVAYRYGVSDAVDAYQFTMTMATWLPVTIVGVLSVVLIPVLVRLRRAERAERDDFIRELQGWVLAAGIALALLTWLAWPYALDWLGGGLSPQVRAMTGDLLVAFAPVSALLLVAGISAARLRAHERHVNTLLDSVPAVATLAWVMLAVSADGVGPLLWALSLATPSRRSGSPGWPRGPIPDSGGATLYLALAALAGIDGRRRRDADRPGGDELCRPAGPVCRRQSGANANATLGYASRLLS